jgi:hypothetical protein
LTEPAPNIASLDFGDNKSIFFEVPYFQLRGAVGMLVVCLYSNNRFYVQVEKYVPMPDLL